MPDLFRQAMRCASREDITLHEAGRAMFGLSGAELGGALAPHWNFRETLADSVLHRSLKAHTVPDEEGPLTSSVVRWRACIRVYGLSDGVEVRRRGRAPASGRVRRSPPRSYARAGGADGVLDRVKVFLDSTGPR